MSVTPEVISELAAAPASVSVDGQTVQERSADDLIKLDQYQASKRALKPTGGRRRSPFSILRPTSLIPPGNV